MLKRFLVDKSGAIFLNDVKRFGKGTILVPGEANSIAVAVANSFSSPILIEGPQEAVSEFFSLQGSHMIGDPANVAARLEVQITDVAYRRRLMNRHVLANHVFGNAQRPFRLMETTILDAQQTLMFEFKNNAVSGTSNFKIALEAWKLQRYGSGLPAARAFLADNKKRMSYLYPYWLTTEAAVTIPITNGGTVDVYFRNPSDQWLLLGKLMGQSIPQAVGSDPETAELFAFDLWDPKSERKLNNQPVTLNTGTGTAQFPFLLDPPLLVEPLSNIHMRLYNLLSAYTQEVFLTFAGVGCYTGAALFAPEQQNQPANAAAIPQGMYLS
jgi:hypothetical protein